VYDVVEKNTDSSSKSNPLSRRRKKITTRRREGGGVVVVEKKIKSLRIFNKNYCGLLTAITHTKILVAYFIISHKKLKYKWHITAARPTHYFVGLISMFLDNRL